jgi:amino acid transporter
MLARPIEQDTFEVSKATPAQRRLDCGVGRLVGLDGLRAGMMLLGIVLHAANAHAVGAPNWWPVQDDYRSGIFDAFIFSVHSFRMELFFLLAGFFARLLMVRHGVDGFTSNRCRRVLLPLVIGVGVMIVVMAVWCGVTIWMRGAVLPPFDLHFSGDALGWLSDSQWPKRIGAFGIVIAFGHSILAMSGEESLAQVNREIAYPKVKNLVRAGFVIFLYSMLMTGLISFFAVLIIPDEVRMSAYSDNLIGGLAMYVVGPLSVRLALRVFVVIVGFLILAGAVNTAIVGSNGVLNRVAEDGVLPDWLRHPHRRYGTTSRIINLVVGLQIFTIIASGGNSTYAGAVVLTGTTLGDPTDDIIIMSDQATDAFIRRFARAD